MGSKPELETVRGLAAAISWGSLFHFRMDPGMNDICLWCVLQRGILLLCVLFFLRLNRFSVGFGRRESGDLL